jgi:hypothetical protein
LIRHTLDKSGGAALLDAKVTSSTTGLPLVYYRECQAVEGQPAAPAERSEP